MTPTVFVNILFEKVFDTKQAQSNAEQSRVEIEKFLLVNPSLLTTSPSKVTNFLLQSATELTNKGASTEIISNVYLTDSVKFAILSCYNSQQLPELKKYAKIFIEILKFSAHFTIEYKKPMKHSKRIILPPTMPVELFWLLPLFQNKKVLLNGNMQAFIDENINIVKSVGTEYMVGYQFFTENVTTFEITNFKQYVRDSQLKGLQNINN